MTNKQIEREGTLRVALTKNSSCNQKPSKNSASRDQFHSTSPTQQKSGLEGPSENCRIKFATNPKQRKNKTCSAPFDSAQRCENKKQLARMRENEGFQRKLRPRELPIQLPHELEPGPMTNENLNSHPALHVTQKRIRSSSSPDEFDKMKLTTGKSVLKKRQNKLSQENLPRANNVSKSKFARIPASHQKRIQRSKLSGRI